LALDLKTIEALAPDQASLSAAAKLTKRSNWARLEKNAAQTLIWGECQGSGSNPYRIVVDTADHGYKCTCPSRKFPCKHSLALMWMDATAAELFIAADTPEWVTDWLVRRRRPAAAPGEARATNLRASGEKSIGEAEQPEAAKPEDPAAVGRREAAQRKRAEESRLAVSAALIELEQWIADQLRLGLSGFVENSSERCRRIAARLVDMKATGLAGRIDEIPSRLMALRSEERPDAAIRELGKLVLLAKAWRQTPNDPELRRLVSTSETRDQILANPDAPQVDSSWEVLGEKIETRRDSLVSHATWLLDLRPSTAPRFAVLLDYYPASAGRRSNAFAAGDRFEARLVFYPARTPLRALIAERRGRPAADIGWPDAERNADPLAAQAARQDDMPWASDGPVLLPAGAILRDEKGAAWWQADDDAKGIALPVAGSVPEAVLGLGLDATAGLWNGARLELLAAQSGFGRIDLS
jgi:hypothetical protein